MADKTISSNGLGFGSLLTLIFVTLKLTHFISWSWWWVLSPEWISLSVVFLLFLPYIAYKLLKD